MVNYLQSTAEFQFFFHLLLAIDSYILFNALQFSKKDRNHGQLVMEEGELREVDFALDHIRV